MAHVADLQADYMLLAKKFRAAEAEVERLRGLLGRWFKSGECNYTATVELCLETKQALKGGA